MVALKLYLDTGFLERQIILPQFILQELQQVADASKDQKSARGRRGLEILKHIQKYYPDRILINSIDYE